ncbi:MAG: hypothetical protein H6719_13765 [Sandaracinaceae bacterium]|nr:hypothetical protein [Sandaracinaceae bacterium]
MRRSDESDEERPQIRGTLFVTFVSGIVALFLALPATAQAPRSPRVQVVVERGPIPVRVLERAWPSRAFRRCEAEAPDDVIHVHVRIDPDASVSIDHGAIDDEISLPARCVVEVLTSARFHPQVEATHAYVTVFFRPNLRGRAQLLRARSSTSAAASFSYSAREL